MTSTLDQRINTPGPQPGNPPLRRHQGVGHPSGPSGSDKSWSGWRSCRWQTSGAGVASAASWGE